MSLKPRPALDRPAVIRHLQETVDRLGKLPTRPQFRSATGIPKRTVLRLFGSHRELLRAAGFETYSSASRLDDQTLLRAMGDALDAAGTVPTREAFAGHCRHDLRTVTRRWGGWENALAALRDWLEANQPQSAHLPALRRRCQGIKLGSRSHLHPRCGELIRFRGLDHAPTNEMGVVFLFGAVADELGFILDHVGTAFPDALGRRRVGRGWQPVRIEFEFQSRTFRLHEHSADKCDLIVCWEDNWRESPLEVLELRSRIQALASSSSGSGPRAA